MVGEFSHGVGALIKGFGLMLRPGVKRYAALPFAINFIVFAAIIWFGAHEFAYAVQWIEAQLPEWLDWLKWLLWVLFGGVALLVVFYCFTFLIYIVGFPFNVFLASRVDRSLNGRSMKGAEESFWRGFGADMGSLVQVLRYQIVWTVIVAVIGLVLLFIPGLNLLVPALWFVFGAWMLALGYSDLALGQRGYRFKSQRQIFDRHRGRVLGFGCATAFATLFPILNLLVMPAAVAGAVWLWQDIPPRSE
ncbi:MAG TPA: sulfate transporter CysZ [Gammaproteobacteria bacterium]|jgi:CysZ protein|nr:sulfate transporter CysZ [Gammaproteobacteria bacterium]HET7588510.1 sulfate transporter CysZ [Gammaproteobacteria bacterium]